MPHKQLERKTLIHALRFRRAIALRGPAMATIVFVLLQEQVCWDPVSELATVVKKPQFHKRLIWSAAVTPPPSAHEIAPS